MEPENFIIVGFQANGDRERRIDGRGPCEFLFGQLFASALDDEFFSKFGAVFQHSFLEFNRDFTVFQQAPRGVDLDHSLVFETVKLLFGCRPLSMKILVGNVVSRVVEVATKSAPGRPPPVASLGPQNDRYCTAGRSVRENFRGGVDRGWFTSCLLYTSPSPRDRG